MGDDDDVMLISDGGTLVRTSARGISTLGRNTQGVTLIRLREGEKLVGIARIETEEKTGVSAELANELEAALTAARRGLRSVPRHGRVAG
jgi:DNA gyrase subunit A